jgi:hypothetical protein
MAAQTGISPSGQVDTLRSVLPDWHARAEMRKRFADRRKNHP